MKYVVISTHPPNSCPSSSAAAREGARSTLSKLEPTAKKLNVHLEGGYVLSPSHTSVIIFDAPNIETVRELIFNTGFAQWNEVQINVAWSIEDAMKAVESLEPLKW